MPVLNIIIADAEEGYVAGVSNYILENHPGMFKIHTFTNQNIFLSFLDTSKEPMDILLLSDDFFTDTLTEKSIALIVLLSSGRFTREYQGCAIINKYIPGNLLVSHILKLFSEKTSDFFLPSLCKKAGVNVFYSPKGGTGTSSLCYGAAILAAQKGNKTFYLNLETVSSVSYLFENRHHMNLSNIFYDIRKGHKNVVLNLKAAVQTDMFSGIDYILPPDCMLEIYDLTSHEYEKLLEVLRGMGTYDCIFVDLPSDLRENLFPVFYAADSIFLCGTPDGFCRLKMTSFLNDITLIYNKTGKDISSKFIHVMNQVRAKNVSGEDDAIEIPFMSNLFSFQNQRAYMNLDGKLLTSMEGLLSHVKTAGGKI